MRNLFVLVAGVALGVGVGYAALKLLLAGLEKTAERTRVSDADDSDEDLMVDFAEMPLLTPFLH